MVHRVYEQNRCAGQSTACNLQGFMFQGPISVVPLHYACLYQKRTDAQHCETESEHYDEVNVCSSFLKEKEVKGQNLIH